MKESPPSTLPNAWFLDWRVFAPLLITVIGFLAYCNSLSGQFLWDDEGLIVQNQTIKDWQNLPRLFQTHLRSGATLSSNFYRPLQMFTYMVDYSLWGLRPHGYHVTNLLLHLLTAVSVFFLIARLAKNRVIAFMTGILFVVHPVHTEAVSYISGRADLLATFFGLLSFLFYLKCQERYQRGYLVLLLVFYSLSLLSKESALVFPILAMVYHAVFKTSLRVKSALAGLVVLTLLYVTLRVFILGAVAPPIPETRALWERLPGFFAGIAIYFKVLFWPFHLHMEYPNRAFSFMESSVLLGILLLWLGALLLFLKRAESLYVYAIGWFFVAVLPYTHIFPLNAIAAEHWLYCPSIGFFLIVSKVIYDQASIPRRGGNYWIIAFVALVLLWAGLTHRQNHYWKNSLVLHEYLARVSPSSRVYNNLAKTYYENGQTERALETLEKAATMEPGNFQALNNLGILYQKIGEYEKAETLFKQVIFMVPRDPRAYHYLGTMAYNRQDAGQALSWFFKALTIDPQYPEPLRGVAAVYKDSQRYSDAVEKLLVAVRVNPDFAEAHHDLASLYVKMRRYSEALASYERAERLGLKDEELESEIRSHI